MAVRLTRKPALPGVTARDGPLVGRLKELVEVWDGVRGDSLDRVVTHREMVAFGLTEEVQANSGRFQTSKITSKRLGAFAVTAANIDEQAIGTRAILEEAVTVPVQSYTAGALALTAAHQTLAQASIESSGRPISILCSAILSITSSNVTTTANVEVRITEDGVVVWGPFDLKAVVFSGATGTVRNAEEGFANCIQRTPNADRHTYAFQARISGTLTNVTGSGVSRSILLLELKR